jgi:hypothetical protein
LCLPWASPAPLWREPLVTTWTQNLRLAESVRGGVRDAGEVPPEFGVRPLQEPESGRPQERARVIDAAQDADAILNAVCGGKESIARVREIAAGEAARVLQGEAPRYPVNRAFEMGRERTGLGMVSRGLSRKPRADRERDPGALGSSRPARPRAPA